MAKASGDEKAELKQAKKAAKKQEKYNKKLAKMIKKQQKLFKKSQKLESDLERINLQLDDVAFTETKTQVVSHSHIHWSWFKEVYCYTDEFKKESDLRMLLAFWVFSFK